MENQDNRATSAGTGGATALAAKAAAAPAPAAGLHREFEFAITSCKEEKNRFGRAHATPAGLVKWFEDRGHKVGEKDLPTGQIDIGGQNYPLGGWVPATIRSGGRLVDADVESVQVLVLDFDNKDPATGQRVSADKVVTIDAVAAKLGKFGVIVTSHSHTPDWPRFRVILPLDAAVSPPEFARLWQYLHELTGRTADTTCRNPSHMYYLPRCTQEAKDAGWPEIRRLQGPLLGMTDIPADFVFTGPAAAPSRSLGAPHLRLVPKQGLHCSERYDIPELKRKLELLRTEPIIEAMLAGEVELGREAWRFVLSNLVLVCLDYGPEGEELGREFAHEISRPDRRPSHGYDANACDAQYRDSLRQAAGAPDADALSVLAVTYERLEKHGAPTALCAAGRKVAKAPSGWLHRRWEATQAASDPDVPVSPLAMFHAALAKDPQAAVEDALQRPDLLADLGRMEKADVASFEALKSKLSRIGVKKTRVDGLVKAARATLQKANANAPPAGSGKGSSVAGSQTPLPGVSKPQIAVEERQLIDIVEEAEQALTTVNPGPSLFLRSGSLVSVEVAAGTCNLKDHNRHSVMRRLAKVADWVEKPPDPIFGLVTDVFPPKELPGIILAVPPRGLPTLESVVSCPVFGAGGNLLVTSGYHATDAVWVDLKPGLVPPVAAKPTDAEVAAALTLLFDDLWKNFPFVHAADKAHVLAAALLVPARRLIAGPTPPHLVEATKSSTGKGKLGDTIAIMVQGAKVAWRPLPLKEEEREKSIFSALRSGVPIIGYDNVKGSIDSPALESVLTSDRITARVLGGSNDQTVANLALWMITANNCSMSVDLARRTVRIRLDAGVELPQHRNDFKHPELETWALANRGVLLHALLTLIQNWVARGKPRWSGKPFASYESWSSVIGGILEAAGVKGFLDEAASLVGIDEETVEARAFVSAWAADPLANGPVTARALYEGLCVEWIVDRKTVDDLERERESKGLHVVHLATLFATGAVNGHVRKLGIWLGKNRDAVHAGYRISDKGVDGHTKLHQYQLEPVSAPTPTPQPPADDAPHGVEAPPVSPPPASGGVESPGENPDFSGGSDCSTPGGVEPVQGKP